MLAGYIYAALIVVLVCFQFCMALGMPWGHLANGGRWRGTLPPYMRVAAIGQAGILVFMGIAVATRAGLLQGWPGWTFWVALGVTILTTIANWATPSPAERRLWGPVTLVLSITVITIAIGGSTAVSSG
ncbi:hypothetical protein [Aliiroseovarius sp. F20344]|uniref:hypothetical protein n=1 Tax=Aliiroseovarius sp. F20344 TaxID=2926414 RepID=UPI001FF6A041|nr:hypothetical protein [Aliiroseovarius sp. F20344]MCK0142435.1 hypothetical protein [Aliiroseovarius sp. F20344]